MFKQYVGQYFGHLSTHFASQDVEKQHLKLSVCFEQYFGVILDLCLAPFWRPTETQMHLDGLLGHPVGPFRFPRRSKGVQGRPRSFFLTIVGTILAHFGEHEGCIIHEL